MSMTKSMCMPQIETLNNTSKKHTTRVNDSHVSSPSKLTLHFKKILLKYLKCFNKILLKITFQKLCANLSQYK